MEETTIGLGDAKHPGNEMEATEEAKKGIRRRKKLLITKLRVQMEFYFSASNLSKDKFMNGLLEKDPYIDLEVFFSFNKIRTLTDDMNLLKRAIEKSPILELSEDGKKVKRSKPVEKKENETLCTIYVESIPSHVDHEWIHDIFARYGTIDYISFPRFKSTGRPKGFAFVEFETPQMANVALKCFGAEGCTIPVDTEPSKLRSICTHEAAGTLSDNQLQSVECVGNEKGNRLKSKDDTLSMQCKAEYENCEKDEICEGGVMSINTTEVKDSDENIKDNVDSQKEREEKGVSLLGKRKRNADDDDVQNGTSDKESLAKKPKNDNSEPPKADSLQETSEGKVSERIGKEAVKTGDSEIEEEEIGIEKTKCLKRKGDSTVDIEVSKVNREDEESTSLSKIPKKGVDVVEDPKITEKQTAEKETSEEKLDSSTVEDIIREVRRTVDEEKGQEQKHPDQIRSILSSKKRSLDSSEEGCPTKAKKHRVSFDTSGISVCEDSVRKHNENLEDGASPRSKKKKRRKRNRRDKGECLEGMSLKVMSKQEWTRLRNQYLNMQKRNMESLKWDLQKRKYVPEEPPLTNKTQSKHQPKFVPNAIIKISFEEPPQDPKKLQETIREGGRGGVAYVETSATEKDVYVRFITGESAAAYLKAGLWSRMILLSDDEEKEYWNHCIDSWNMRRNKKNKGMKGTSSDIPNKLRGREKLLQKALREAQNDKPNSHKIFEN